MARLNTILFVICGLIVSVLAASPASFCKCTCFTNSTIIPLSAHSPSTLDSRLEVRAQGGTCILCNRAFCLEQSLPICKGAEEKDVFTTCFQRDSRKDQIVVFTFIASTVGLLGWSAVKKVLEKRRVLSIDETSQQGYVAVQQ